MSQSQFPKQSNIFDDHNHISPDKLDKYRNADLLDLMSFSRSQKSSLEKLQTSSFPSLPKVLTQEVFTSTTWSLNIPDLDKSVLTPIKAQNIHMEYSAAVTQVPPTEASLNRKAALSSVSETNEQQVPYRLSTIFEEESPLQEEMDNVENNEHNEAKGKTEEKAEEVKDTCNNLLDGVKGFTPINLKDIKLDTSINFQFKKIDFPLIATVKAKDEEEDLKTVESRQEEINDEKDEAIVEDYLEKMQRVIPYDYNETKSDHPEEFVPIPVPEIANKENIAVAVQTNVDIEDRGVDACDFMTVEKEDQGVQAAPVFVDKVVDTAELIFEEEKEEIEENIVKEEVIKEDKVVDTSNLVSMQDEFTDTIELVDDERMKSIEEVKKLKFKFLGELHGLRNKLDLIKQDQADSKKGTSESIQETIKSVSEFVRAGLEKYIKEKSQKQLKNLRAYQTEVSQTKNELEKLKSFVQFTADKMKEKIAAYFNNEGKKLLEKLIDDSHKEKVRQYIEMMGDNNSVTTDSSHVTPSKATPSKPRQSYRRRPHKLDPAVIDGLMYLFEHDALKNTMRTEKDFKEKLRKILKTNEADKATSEFLLGTLMDRSSRKKGEKSESRAPSESPEKRKRKKSLHEGDDDDNDDDGLSDFKSVTSGRGGLSTPGKGSARKQAKRDLKSYKSFMDENGDKVFVVPEDLEQEGNE